MKMTFGLIVANRGFFPDELAMLGRKDMLEVLKKAGHNVITLSLDDTKYGSVETYSDAKICAELFKKNADKIDGIIVTHPNFGDERGVAVALSLSGLNVPVLIQATPDAADKMDIKHRRDSFCGKISTCNNLIQHGIKFTLTSNHCVDPKSSEFKSDLEMFSKVSRIVKGFKNIRVGAIGARTGAFDTVRYSEKILENNGISVQVIDLSEIFGKAGRLTDNDLKVKAKLSEIKDYINTSSVSSGALLKMAKFGLVVDGWIKENELVGTAIQCWTSMEEYFGVVPCSIMSMMSNSLVPSACEVDITGLLSMYALQLASETPSAILDWNNNYGDDPDACMLFHCSNVPKSFFKECRMDFQEIIAGSVGKENTYGTCVGRFKEAPFTYLKIQTDDFTGQLKGYTGEGNFTNDKPDSFGGYGVAKIGRLQELMKYICSNGLEHHVAANMSSAADAVCEALSNYKGWKIYKHR